MRNDLVRREDLLKRVERLEKQGTETVPLELLRVIIETTEKVDLSTVCKANGWVKLPRGTVQSCKFCGAWHPFNFTYCPHCGKKVDEVM